MNSWYIEKTVYIEIGLALKNQKWHKKHYWKDSINCGHSTAIA